MPKVYMARDGSANYAIEIKRTPDVLCVLVGDFPMRSAEYRWSFDTRWYLPDTNDEREVDDKYKNQINVFMMKYIDYLHNGRTRESITVDDVDEMIRLTQAQISQNGNRPGMTPGLNQPICW